jgi:DNA invertase Pin-like site-specific DNA recombinase
MQPNGLSGRVSAVVYARVSSKEQEREGFSIPAQLELLRDYARQRSMIILHEFVDIESASTNDKTRTGFSATFQNSKSGGSATLGPWAARGGWTRPIVR